MMVGSELPSPETRESTVTEVLLEVATSPSSRCRRRRVTVGRRAPTAPAPHVLRRTDRSTACRSCPRRRDRRHRRRRGQRPDRADRGDHRPRRRPTGGVALDGEDITRRSTRSTGAPAGIGYIPEDRQQDGMVLPFPLWENVAARPPDAGRRSPTAAGSTARRRRAAHRARSSSDFDVRTPEHRGAGVHAVGRQPAEADRRARDDDRARRCSIAVPPDPRRRRRRPGGDLGHPPRRPGRRARRRCSISADLEELIGLSDRLLVMLRGRIVAELDPADVTPAELGSYMTGRRDADGR